MERIYGQRIGLSDLQTGLGTWGGVEETSKLAVALGGDARAEGQGGQGIRRGACRPGQEGSRARIEARFDPG